MAFLRVAVFEADDAPADGLELWEDIIGSALRNHPDCVEVLASRSGNRFAVVSLWSSAESLQAATASKPIEDLRATIGARLNMATDQEPVFLFEGEVSGRP